MASCPNLNDFRFYHCFFSSHWIHQTRRSWVPVVGVEPCRSPKYHWPFFFWDFSVVSVDYFYWSLASWCQVLSFSALESFVIWAWALTAVMCISWLPWWQWWLMSQLTEACILALVSVLVACWTTESYSSSSRPFSSIESWIDSLKPS